MENVELREYMDMTDYMLATMCPHTMLEFLEKVELMFPAIYEWGSEFCTTAEEFIAAVALKYREAFKSTLADLSVGCYQY